MFSILADLEFFLHYTKNFIFCCRFHLLTSCRSVSCIDLLLTKILHLLYWAVFFLMGLNQCGPWYIDVSYTLLSQIFKGSLFMFICTIDIIFFWVDPLTMMFYRATQSPLSLHLLNVSLSLLNLILILFFFVDF